MTQGLMLSMILATVGVPVFAARHASPVRAFRFLAIAFVAICLLYALVVVFVTPYPHVQG